MTSKELLFDSETTLIYQGGSGGFFLFYLMLLSNHYASYKNLDIQKQFPSELKLNRKEWKQYEIVPDHLEDTIKPKLNIICNPLFDRHSFFKNYDTIKNTKKILLYTDLDSQLRLAFEKNAYWFTDAGRTSFNAPINNLSYIKQIKKDFAIYDGKKVDPKLPIILQLLKPDVIINLSEILVNREQFNTKQQEFIDYWVSLQSHKALRKLKL